MGNLLEAFYVFIKWFTVISFKSLSNPEGGHNYNSYFINEETEANRGWETRLLSKKEGWNENIVL